MSYLHYCDHAFSVAGPSLNFRLLLWDSFMESNETWQKTRSQRPLPALRNSRKLDRKQNLNFLYQVCVFRTDWKKKQMAALASDLLRHFRPFLWNRWKEFNLSCQEQDLNVLYQICVFRADWKNMMATLVSDWLRYFRLFLRNHLTLFNETWLEARSLRPLPILCFRDDQKKKQDGRPCLGLAKTFLTSPLLHLKNKMAALAPDWLRHFKLLLWNRWTEFN